MPGDYEASQKLQVSLGLPAEQQLPNCQSQRHIADMIGLGTAGQSSSRQPNQASALTA
jgi:hypothetical protein